MMHLSDKGINEDMALMLMHLCEGNPIHCKLLLANLEEFAKHFENDERHQRVKDFCTKQKDLPFDPSLKAKIINLQVEDANFIYLKAIEQQSDAFFEDNLMAAIQGYVAAIDILQEQEDPTLTSCLSEEVFKTNIFDNLFLCIEALQRWDVLLPFFNEFSTLHPNADYITQQRILKQR